MNYCHIYHAGNFADVFKHTILSFLFKSLQQKEMPFCYLDTHAGVGRYDLTSEAALKTGEFRDGIQRLWHGNIPEDARDYLAVVRAENPAGAMNIYPGSPAIARYFLRPQDRMVLLEYHPAEFTQLKNLFSGDRQVLVSQGDGYAGLKSYLPPKENRGLVLIDPPYESDREYEQVLESLKMAHARWRSGIYALWYPIKTRAAVDRFHRALTASGIRKILMAEISPYPEDVAFRLNGCGMVLVNPPWKLDESLQRLLPDLLEVLRQHREGRSRQTWLVPE